MEKVFEQNEFYQQLDEKMKKKYEELHFKFEGNLFKVEKSIKVGQKCKKLRKISTYSFIGGCIGANVVGVIGLGISGLALVVWLYSLFFPGIYNGTKCNPLLSHFVMILLTVILGSILFATYPIGPIALVIIMIIQSHFVK